MKGNGDLVKVDLPSRLQYAFMGYKGALSVPLLERRVADALVKADRLVRAMTRGCGRILVWDALRTRECQREIWNRYEELICREFPGATPEDVRRRVAKFVSNPDGTFRHGTGGSVDVTLLLDGVEAEMGTGFDEFNERSAAGFFVTTPPVTARDVIAHENRIVLNSAMEEVGFVVLPEEWWHFEFGTEMWAEMRGGDPFLTEVLAPPQHEVYAAEIRSVPKSFPSLATGVAQSFATRWQRRHALEGKSKAHYYARSATPARTNLEAYFRKNER